MFHDHLLFFLVEGRVQNSSGVLAVPAACSIGRRNTWSEGNRSHHSPGQMHFLAWTQLWPAWQTLKSLEEMFFKSL